ncbi:acyl carrier protein [Amycolatopsis sp. NPDC059657]|uniref:acyl carrier protein n=1 Tax=Amycolatopsis sp. NPDC059657 TaxID=3346899 RepID=UPI00366DBA33
MNKSEIADRIMAIIADVGGLDISQIKAEKYFADDLDIDSLGLVEIGATIEDDLGVEIPDEELAELTTVGAVTDFVESRILSAAAG